MSAFAALAADETPRAVAEQGSGRRVEFDDSPRLQIDDEDGVRHALQQQAVAGFREPQPRIITFDRLLGFDDLLLQVGEREPRRAVVGTQVDRTLETRQRLIRLMSLLVSEAEVVQGLRANARPAARRRTPARPRLGPHRQTHPPAPGRRPIAVCRQSQTP